ncbi:unnamed protein product, partial [Staurois parvus]
PNKCILIALCESYSVYKLWYRYCNLRHFFAIQCCASLTDNCAVMQYGKILGFLVFFYTNNGGDQRLMAAISDLWRRSATYGRTAADILTLGGTDLGSLTSPVTPIQ